MSKNYLSKNDELRPGDTLMSNNGEFKAIFQEDSNFVIYGWKPVWHSDTATMKGFRLCMQHDCNLVMYTKEGKPIWQSDSAKDSCNMCRLQLTDEGKLALYREHDEVWNSANSQGRK